MNYDNNIGTKLKMAVERIGEVNVSAAPGVKKVGGSKSKVLKLRIPFKTVEEIGIIRSDTPVALYIDPEIEIAKKTGVFSLIYKFDLNEMRKNEIHDQVSDKIKADDGISLDIPNTDEDNNESGFDIGDIVGEKNGVE